MALFRKRAAVPEVWLGGAVEVDEAAGTVSYRWKADEPAFAMPIRVGTKDHRQIIKPTTTGWQTMKTALIKDQFEVATDLYYVNVDNQ